MFFKIRNKYILFCLFIVSMLKGGLSMNHSELVKEADRLSKTDAWGCAYELLQRKEREKLNHIKVYECQNTLTWYISDFGGSGESATYPFGFFFADYFNQILSLRSKEAFVAYEKRMHSGAKSEKNISPIFDKRYRFYMWAYDEALEEKIKIDSHTTDRELEAIYDNICWLWEYVKNDMEHLRQILNDMQSLSVPNEIIYNIYKFTQRFAILNWHRQISSSHYDKNSKMYKYLDEHSVFGMDAEENEKDNQEMISSDFVMSAFTSGFRYMGYENIKFTDNTESFCRVYDVSNLLHLVAEDMLRFMLHQTTHNFEFCPECGCMFVTTHGNQKHCPACNLIIRQKKRKQNKARYLHKKITDYINNYRSGEDENASEAFRNESNYYWAICQGKTPEKIKEYSAKIKTEADYMKWLEKKYEEIKANK